MNDDCLHINERNVDCDRVNKQRLMDLKSPIVLINAMDINCNTQTYSDDHFRRLRPRIYTAIGARMMLTWNVCVNVGLVNGSIGNVIDIVYADNTEPPSLPAFIIMNIVNYSGPVFFHGEGRQQWVPILPQTYEFTTLNGQKASRTQFPLQLAYSLTAHKAQGLTCSSKIVVVISDKEKNVGITYVQLSRCTDINNLCLLKAVTLERMTTGISKSQSLRFRLIEENRLISLWKKTKEKFSLSTDDYSLHVLPDCVPPPIKATRQKSQKKQSVVQPDVTARTEKPIVSKPTATEHAEILRSKRLRDYDHHGVVPRTCLFVITQLKKKPCFKKR